MVLPQDNRDEDHKKMGLLKRWWQSLLYEGFKPVVYSRYEHCLMRVIVAITVCRSLPYNCETLISQPEPNGIAQFFDLTPICAVNYYDLWRVVVFIAAMLFATNRFTFLSLLAMSIVHTSIFTLKNSQGWIGHNNQVVSLTLIIQCVHYGWCGIKRWFLSHSTSLKSKVESNNIVDNVSQQTQQQPTDDDLAVWYTQQAVAATYVISAITKHVLSFNGWILDSPNLVLQVLKTNEMGYYNFLLHAYADDKLANYIVGKLLETPRIAIVLFAPAYLLEAGAFLSLYNRTALLLGGVSLIGMHLGISLIMRLNFKYNEAILLAYFINAPYWINLLYQYIAKTRLLLSSSSSLSTSSSSSSSPSTLSSSIISSSVIVSNQKKSIDHIL